MSNRFKTIGLIGKYRSEGVIDTLQAVQEYLDSRKLKMVIEAETAKPLGTHNLPVYSKDELGKDCDLIIVVGGDGSMLNASLTALKYDRPILGINRGRLGFLTDIHPTEIKTKLGEILDGHYKEEFRLMLDTHIERQNQHAVHGIALNDFVLSNASAARMVEFEISIDHQFVCSQRADGLIVTTPTGSTAYALSGGGPIMHPSLEAVALVPMFPHTLSSRPIVINASSKIHIHISEHNSFSPNFSCDGHTPHEVKPGDNIYIQRNKNQLRLIHPVDYNYYETLRVKMQWETRHSC